MAPRITHPALWLLTLLNGTAFVQASFWTVTSNYVYQLDISTYTYMTPLDYYTYTTTRTVQAGVTPTGQPVETSTYLRDFQDLEIVSVFYPASAVDESQLEPTDTDGLPLRTSSTGLTIFMMPVTYTAPATCTSSFTFATEELVMPPSEVYDQLSPATVVTDAPYTYATYTGQGYETWILTAEAVPITTTDEYYYSVYVAQCKKPSSLSSGDYDDPEDSLSVCSWYSGCTSLRVWVIIIATLLPALFLLGFLESWFWFRRLMLGKSALRFGTVCWVFISLWVVCFTRKQGARSTDDQRLLREQWNKTSSGAAFKLWWKHGFRHSYPEDVLGKYSPNTIGIQRPGALPIGQPVYGQPMMTQQGQVAMPPPEFYNQQGGNLMPGQGYYEQGKEATNVATYPAPMPTQSPPPQMPTPSVSPPISHAQYTAPTPPPAAASPAQLSATPSMSPPIPASYPNSAQSPPPLQGHAQLPASPAMSPPIPAPYAPVQSPHHYQGFPPPQGPPPHHGPPPGQS